MEKLASKKINWRTSTWPQNWLLKLLSLLFAVFLWYFVVGEDKVDITLQIPIEIVNLPENLTISNQFKKNLEVTVNGPRGLVRNLSKQHLSRPLDLSKAAPGTMIVKNTADSISLPRGVRLLRVKPTDVIIQLDKLTQKVLPIIADTEGNLPEGYVLVSISTKPSSIPLVGPQVVVEQQDSLSTAPIILTGLTNSVSIPVALMLSPAISDLVGEPIVTAKIKIQEKMVEKTIKNIPVQLSTSNGKTVPGQPNTVTVKAKIPYTLLRGTKNPAALFTSRIVGGDLPPGKHKLSVKITTVGGIEIIEIIPQMVIVDIPGEKKKAAEPKKQPANDVGSAP